MFLGSSSLMPTAFVGSKSLIVLLSIALIFCAESMASAATADEIRAAQQACLQEKVEAAEQKKKKKKLFGSALSGLSKSLSKIGGDKLATISSDVFEANATANDIAEVAKELGISESDVADCQELAGAAAAASTTVSTTANTATTTAKGGAGKQPGYGDRTSFHAGAFKLGEIDAMHQVCEGQRPDYRERYDALVTKAHPDFRDQALTVYDQRYQTYIEVVGSGLTSSCTPAQSAQLEQLAAMYFKMLEPGIASPAPTTVSAQNTPSQAPTATVASTTAASPTPTVAATSTAAPAASTPTSSQANAGPLGTARALAQTRSDECKAISAEVVPDALVAAKMYQDQDQSRSLAYRDLSQCQSDCNKAVGLINSADRTHPNYMSTHETPQKDVDRSIAACNSSYDTAIASYAKFKGPGSAGDATLASTGAQGTGTAATASATASTPQHSNLWSDSEILLARDRTDECKSIELETAPKAFVVVSSSVHNIASRCATSCNAAWSSMSSAKHQVGAGETDRNIEIHVSNCKSYYEQAAASYVEHQEQKAAQAAERDTLVASTSGADAVANVLDFFAQHSTMDIQISGGDFSGVAVDDFTRHAKFNIADIESAAYRRRPSQAFISFICRNGSNCIQLGVDRGNGPEYMGANTMYVPLGPWKGGAEEKFLEPLKAVGLDLERWAHSVGGDIDANFENAGGPGLY